MASRKRTALSNIDANITPKRVANGTRKPRTDIRVTFRETAFEGPYEYIYIRDTRNDASDNENDGTAAGEDDEESHIKHGHTAYDYSHKHIMMREAWDLLEQYRRLASYCDPDNFDMYIRKDFFGLGVEQCIEMLVLYTFYRSRSSTAC